MVMAARRWSTYMSGLRFSVPVTVIYAIASFVGALIAFGSRTETFVTTAFAALLVTVVAVGFLWVVRVLVAGNKDLDVVVYFLLALGIGLVRGATMVALGVRWELLAPGTAWAQVINSGVSAMVWLGLAGFLFAGRERYRRLYRSLLAQGAAQWESRDCAITDWDQHPTIRHVRANVAAHLSEAHREPTPAALIRTADAIRTEIEVHLRPLSHRLWFGSFEDSPRVRLPHLLKDSLTTFRMPIRIVVTAWCIGGFIGAPMLFGPVRGIVATLISGTVLGVLLIGFTAIARRRQSFARGVTYVLVAGTVPIASADLVLRAVGFSSDLTLENGLLLLLPLALIAMMVMGLTISMANADRELVLAVAQRYAKWDPLSPLVTELEISTYLHNTMQSELTGAALQLRHAADSADPKRARAALAHAEQIVQRSIVEDLLVQREAATARAERLVEAWDGICAVDIAIDPITSDDARVFVAIQALEELIANAVRHAGATKVRAGITPALERITLTCRIDRHWQSGSRVGLGTQFLCAVAPDGLESHQDGTWTVLTLEIA